MKTAVKKSPPSTNIANNVLPFFGKGNDGSFFSADQTAIQRKPLFFDSNAAVDSGPELADIGAVDLASKYDLKSNYEDQVNNKPVHAGELSLQNSPLVVQAKCATCEVGDKENALTLPMGEEIEIQEKTLSHHEIGIDDIEPKTMGELSIGEKDDSFELEADSIADQVVQKMDDTKSTDEEEETIALSPEKIPETFEKTEHPSSDIQLQTDAISNDQTTGNEGSLNGAANQVLSTIDFTPSMPSIQLKCEACEKEEEEESEKLGLQKKPIFESAGDPPEDDEPGIQRRAKELEKTDYPILFKRMPDVQMSGGGASESTLRDKIVQEAQKMVGKIEAKKDDGSGKRVGAEHLLEIFHLAANDAWPDEVIENVRYTQKSKEFPHWCGIFSVYAIKKAGIDLGYWQIGRGVSAFGTLQPTESPKPGDIGYFHDKQHHCIIKSVNGDSIDSIDGNSGMFSEVIEQTRPREAFTGGFMTAFTGSEKVIQKKSEGSTEQSSSISLKEELSATSGAGRPLDDQTRAGMESGFGADFSKVNIHTNGKAVELNKSLQSHAFTHGNDIYFNQGKYNPQTSTGKHLLAHELTHTIQQGSADQNSLQRYSFGDFVDDVSDSADSATDMISDTVDEVGDTLVNAGESVAELATDIGESIYEAGVDVYEGGVKVVEIASDAASEAIDWLASSAGELARSIVSSFGGIITITADGIVIAIPDFCPVPAMPIPIKLPSMRKDYMIPIFAVPIAPNAAISGDIGVVGHLDPKLDIQAGPFCFNNLRITINPITDTYSIAGGMSATIAAALGAEVRGGVRGQLTLTGIIPIGGVPVPISVPLVGLEGGLAGKLMGIGASTLNLGGKLTYSSGVITASASGSLDMGLGASIFAGAYGQIDWLEENVCRIYWEPWSWFGGIGASLGMGASLSIVPGMPPVFIPSFKSPKLSSIPFDQFPLVIGKKGFADQCDIIDKLCKILKNNGLLPSQNGGSWNWAGPYGPGARLSGPMEVYEKNPGIPSGSECRGACGPNCDTCDSHDRYYYTDPSNGDVWEYVNFQDCPSQDGCREHDAAYDWAADVKGEKGAGWLTVLLPWHMAANIECTCNNLAGNCLAWIAGLPPYDRQIFFADKVENLGPGGEPDTADREECKEEHPYAIDCTIEGSDRDEVLVLWGLDNGYENFRDCRPHRNFPPGVINACDGAPGKTWHCTATDSDTGEDVVISIFECLCCEETGQTGGEYRSPHLSIRLADGDQPSREVPMIKQNTYYEAKDLIRIRDYAGALRVVVADLEASGRINPALYTIGFVDRTDSGEGLTTTDFHLDPATGDYLPDGPSDVEIYTPAFRTVQLLVSTVMHEYQHVLQDQRAHDPGEFDPIDEGGTMEEEAEVAEIEAYLWELEHADETGIVSQINTVKDVFSRLTDHYDELGRLNQTRQETYKERYEKAKEFVDDLEENPPPMPTYQHVYHHGSDYDTVETLRTVDITASGSVDFGAGFYTHTKENWALAREWAIRHSLGKRGWGVVTFPIPDKPWSEEIKETLHFRNARSRPQNMPINPETGCPFKNWKDFVLYNKRKKREGALPDWAEFDVIRGPLWGRLSRNPRIHQVMFTSSGVHVLNRPDVKPLRFLRRWLFLRFR